MRLVILQSHKNVKNETTVSFEMSKICTDREMHDHANLYAKNAHVICTNLDANKR